ncbi:hypothetical protein NEOKW01_1917 [Nematocida sp. AWRm80]|nr:hypothetical protein NEOKW01_1917 [Nematocida sp. AWRm80]
MARGKSKSKKPQKTKRILPVTSDAIINLYEKDVDCTMFKNRGCNWSSEHSIILGDVVDSLSQTELMEKTVESISACEINIPDSETQTQKQVTLDKWAIKLVQMGEDSTFWIIVLGVIKGTDNIVQSSFIKKRVNARTIISTSTKYTLEGEFDDTFSPHPKFASQTLNKFKDGFPHHWKSLIRAQIDLITQDKDHSKEYTPEDENISVQNKENASGIPNTPNPNNSNSPNKQATRTPRAASVVSKSKRIQPIIKKKR